MSPKYSLFLTRNSMALDCSKPYKNIVFDCDGVLLNSNHIKSNAFFSVASQFGTEAANALFLYHISNGGVSRYHKFQHLRDNILCDNRISVVDLCAQYSRLVLSQLLTCELNPVFKYLPRLSSAFPLAVVSGSDQTELQYVFSQRNLTPFFSLGIYGSPDPKSEIIAREIASKNFALPSLYLGDSLYDLRAATSCGLDFVFCSYWTDLKDWTNNSELSRYPSIDSLSNFVLNTLLNAP